MNILENKTDEISDWLDQLEKLCQEYCDCMLIVEGQAKRKEVWDKVKQMVGTVCDGMSLQYPKVLLVLLDAYEITRDEQMLQEILDVVSKNLEQLEVSADSVKLLAYCYYYVEEEECLARARKMLEELKQRGAMEEELTEVEKVLEELAGNF